MSGAVVGTIIANLMFELPAIDISTTARAGAGTFLGEVVATFGLLLLIFAMVRSGRGQLVAFGVGTYIGGAYFFTSSTSFANPAVTPLKTFRDGSLSRFLIQLRPIAQPGLDDLRVSLERHIPAGEHTNRSLPETGVPGSGNR